MITYEKIEEANQKLKSIDIKGKPYMEVNQRVKAFRMCYPTGFITTELVSNANGVAVFKAECGFYDKNEKVILATGTAYEKENSTFINKTSYLENAETSSIGRALGMAGFGIDASIASAEEVGNAIANQTKEPTGKKATEGQVKLLKSRYKGVNLTKLCEANNVTKIEDLSLETASSIIQKLMKKDMEVKENE